MKISNYFYNLSLTVFNLLIPVISFPYVARILGPAGVGKVQFIVTLAQYIALLAAVGIPLYGVREIARARHDRRALAATLKELLLINAGISLLAFAGYLAAVWYHPFFRTDARLYMYGGVLILTGFCSVEWLFTGLEAFRQIALRSIIVKSASLVLLFVLVRLPGDVTPYLLITLAAILANNLWNLATALPMLRGAGSNLRLKQHFRPLFYILGTTIASTLYTTFDSILLGFMSGDEAVGLYAAATKITKIAIPVVMAYGSVLIPEISRAWRASDNTALYSTLNRSYAYIVLLGVPLSVGLFVFSPGLMALFSGSRFLQAVTAMRIMSALPLLIGLGYFWGYQAILPSNRDRLLLYAALSGMAVSLLLNFLLVPAMQHEGAAIANVASEVVVTSAYFLLIRRHMPVLPDQSVLWQAGVASLPFLLFLFLGQDYVLGSRIATLVTGVGACALFYALIQVYSFKNPFLRTILEKYGPAGGHSKKQEP